MLRTCIKIKSYKTKSYKLKIYLKIYINGGCRNVFVFLKLDFNVFDFQQL